MTVNIRGTRIQVDSNILWSYPSSKLGKVVYQTQFPTRKDKGKGLIPFYPTKRELIINSNPDNFEMLIDYGENPYMSRYQEHMLNREI